MSAACDKHNFILGVHVTPGNIHDSVAFDSLYDDICQHYPEHKPKNRLRKPKNGQRKQKNGLFKSENIMHKQKYRLRNLKYRLRKLENIMRNLSKTKQKNLLLMALLSKFLLNRRRRRWVRENRKGFSVDCLTTYRWRRSLLVR